MFIFTLAGLTPSYFEVSHRIAYNTAAVLYDINTSTCRLPRSVRLRLQIKGFDVYVPLVLRYG